MQLHQDTTHLPNVHLFCNLGPWSVKTRRLLDCLKSSPQTSTSMLLICIKFRLVLICIKLFRSHVAWWALQPIHLRSQVDLWRKEPMHLLGWWVFHLLLHRLYKSIQYCSKKAAVMWVRSKVMVRPKSQILQFLKGQKSLSKLLNNLLKQVSKYCTAREGCNCCAFLASIFWSLSRKSDNAARGQGIVKYDIRSFEISVNLEAPELNWSSILLLAFPTVKRKNAGLYKSIATLSTKVLLKSFLDFYWAFEQRCFKFIFTIQLLPPKSQRSAHEEKQGPLRSA